MKNANSFIIAFASFSPLFIKPDDLFSACSILGLCLLRRTDLINMEDVFGALRCSAILLAIK